MTADLWFILAGALFAIALVLWWVVLPMAERKEEEKEETRNAWAIIDREFIEYETDSSRRKR